MKLAQLTLFVVLSSLGLLVGCGVEKGPINSHYALVSSSTIAVSASSDDGNVPKNAIDGNLSTRWSAQGAGQWLELDFGKPIRIDDAKIAFYKGNERKEKFQLLAQNADGTWKTLFDGQSGGKTADLQSFELPDTTSRYLRFVGFGNTSNDWNSISEIRIDALKTPEAPAPTPTVYKPAPTQPTSPPTSPTTLPTTAPTLIPTSLPTVTPLPPQVDPTATPIPTVVTGATFPSQLLNLANWKLTLPTANSNGKICPDSSNAPAHPEAAEVKVLASYSDNYFHVNAAGTGVVFTAGVDGLQTCGTKYPRSELREMNGTALSSWSATTGVHVMRLREAITRAPTKKSQVVGAQIHDSSSDTMEVMYDGTRSVCGGNLCVKYNDDKSAVLLDANYQLGVAYDLKVTVQNGMLVITYNGVEKLNWKISTATSGLYFKAGVYTQSNRTFDSPPDVGEVVLYSLEVTHN